MPVRMQDVETTDALRERVISLRDIGTIAIDTGVDFAMVEGLNGHGATIIAIRGRCVTTPTGTVSATRFDINVNGTTIFTATTSQVYFTKSATGAAATTVPIGGVKAASTKVHNGDIIELACEAKADGAAGADCAIAIVLRPDEPND